MKLKNRLVDKFKQNEFDKIKQNIKNAGARYIGIKDGLVWFNILTGNAKDATLAIKIDEANYWNVKKKIKEKQKLFKLEKINNKEK